MTELPCLQPPRKVQDDALERQKGTAIVLAGGLARWLLGNMAMNHARLRGCAARHVLGCAALVGLLAGCGSAESSSMSQDGGGSLSEGGGGTHDTGTLPEAGSSPDADAVEGGSATDAENPPDAAGSDAGRLPDAAGLEAGETSKCLGTAPNCYGIDSMKCCSANAAGPATCVNGSWSCAGASVPGCNTGPTCTNDCGAIDGGVSLFGSCPAGDTCCASPIRVYSCSIGLYCPAYP
jgi:hypothetical protein